MALFLHSPLILFVILPLVRALSALGTDLMFRVSLGVVINLGDYCAEKVLMSLSSMRAHLRTCRLLFTFLTIFSVGLLCLIMQRSSQVRLPLSPWLLRLFCFRFLLTYRGLLLECLPIQRILSNSLRIMSNFVTDSSLTIWPGFRLV